MATSLSDVELVEAIQAVKDRNSTEEAALRVVFESIGEAFPELDYEWSFRPRRIKNRVRVEASHE